MAALKTHRISPERLNLILHPLNTDLKTLQAHIAVKFGVHQTEPSSGSKTIRQRYHNCVHSEVTSTAQWIRGATTNVRAAMDPNFDRQFGSSVGLGRCPDVQVQTMMSSVAFSCDIDLEGPTNPRRRGPGSPLYSQTVCKSAHMPWH